MDEIRINDEFVNEFQYSRNLEKKFSKNFSERGVEKDPERNVVSSFVIYSLKNRASFYPFDSFYPSTSFCTMHHFILRLHFIHFFHWKK